MFKTKKAFTLIELLVVIAIIGILATISVLALSNARAKSRDAKRAGDIKQIQTALELFFNDKNRYPTAEEWATGKIYSTSTGVTSTYMQVIPTAPTPADGSCTSDKNTVTYTPSSDLGSYSISFCLGNTTGTLTPGPKCLTPGGIIDVDCGAVQGGGVVACSASTAGGTTCSYAGEDYPTVAIGAQVWMAKFLAYLPSVSPSSVPAYPPADYNTPYYYVDGYEGTDVLMAKAQSSYTDYGVLYNYAAALTACPTGWHLPSEADWNTLINYLSVDGQGGAGDANDAGGKLKEAGTTHWTSETCDDGSAPTAVCNSTGFTAIAAPYRDAMGSFDMPGGLTVWSSTFSGGYSSFLALRHQSPSVSISNGSEDGRSYGFSVRCLRD